MLLVDQLDLVGDIMSADFFRLEHVDCRLLGGHVEVPLAEQGVTYAVHRLVSFNNAQ